MRKTAVIIGAGPAGLTAAYELLTKSKIKPIVIEKYKQVGGISRTENFQGNRIDIGGHRFFSKSDRVMDWWLTVFPRMMKRKRKSSIYYQHNLYDYPLSLTFENISKLGFVKTLKIACSYVTSMLMPIKPVRSLEDFFINRFGRELYLTFFKNYTERLWGKPPSEIDPSWGTQRIKSLSVGRAISHFLKSKFRTGNDIRQKDTETSLIDQFLYPPLGPGQVWEHVEKQIIKMGGRVLKNSEVIAIKSVRGKVRQLTTNNVKNGKKSIFRGDYFISTMPVDELYRAMGKEVVKIGKYARGLTFRHFVTVGLLIKRPLAVRAGHIAGLKDNWLYIHDEDASTLRIQIFNSWSPRLVKDPKRTVWIGLEYTCRDNDFIWKASKKELIKFATNELLMLNFIDHQDEVMGGTALKTPKAYPGYFGTYKHFDKIRAYFDKYTNLYLVGRNGMHHYNNQDHSMLSAMIAVENIISGIKDKSNIWAVNTEAQYHETKK